MLDYILSLLEEYINDVNEKIDANKNFNIAFFQDLLKKIDEDKDYFYEFLLDLDDSIIAELVKQIEPVSSQQSFLASVVYLKNLISVNKEQGVDIPLSETQTNLLREFSELIKTTVQNYETKEEELDIQKERLISYESLKDRFTNNVALSVDDYENIEDLIKAKEENPDGILNEVVAFLNNYNYKLLVSESSDTTAVITEDDSEEAKEKQKGESIDIFNPHSFEYPEEEAKPKRKRKAKKIDIMDILIDLNIDANNMDSYANFLINNVDVKRFADNAKYVKENIIERFNDGNINSLIAILCLSNVRSLKELFKFFKEKNISDDIINNLINRATSIFFTDNKSDFIKNYNLLIKYTANMDLIIKDAIAFFYKSYENNYKLVNLLENYHININRFLEKCPQLLTIDIETISYNLELLKQYGFDFDDIDYDSISIIGVTNLNIIIDSFIEAGFSEYIFLNDSLKNTRSLIIKRLFYSYKNELDIWNENVDESRINVLYEDLIRKERKPLSEEDISYMTSDYMILEAKLEVRRPLLFDNTTTAQIKRKYELKYGNIIISRRKTYEVFKVLIEHEVNEKEALFYALTYNLNINNSEYNFIKKEILG